MRISSLSGVSKLAVTMIAALCMGVASDVSAQNWTQRGFDIDGEAAGDLSGHSVSLSADGNTLAIGAKENDGQGFNSGHVRIYDWSVFRWVQRGPDIDGNGGDNSGFSVSLSANGNTVAIGAIGAIGGAGRVRIYDWNGGSWAQRGFDINGEAAGDFFGHSVSLSAAGNTVAIGAIFNDGNGADSGHVRIYDWSSGSWRKRGADIDGERAGDYCGYSVSLSADGNTVAAGAYYNDGNSGNANDRRGHVRIYQWNGSILRWVQRGADIDGERAGDFSGHSVSMSSDGNTVAIGAINNNDNGVGSGQVRIYDWKFASWRKRGADIDGKVAGEFSGYSVSLSANGNAVAIGAIGIAGRAGHARIYDWTVSNWVQRGLDINGEAAGDKSGYSVSLSADGNTVAIGAINNGGNGQKSGHVRVYGVTTPEVTQIDPVIKTTVNGGEIYEITVESNTDWSADSNQSWAQVSPASASGDGKVTVTVASNLTRFQRSATITIGGVEHTLTQDAAEFVAIDLAFKTVTGNGETYVINVESNTDWAVASSESWATVNPASSSGNGTVTVTVVANPTPNQRSATITIGGLEHQLTQEVAPEDIPDIASPDSPASIVSAAKIGFLEAAAGDDYSGYLRSKSGNKALGRFKAMVLKNGRRFSGRIIMGSSTYLLKGRMRNSGRYSKELVPESGSGPSAIVELRLKETTSGAYKLTGTVKRGNKTARIIVVKAGDTSALAGPYTLIIPGEENQPAAPQGHGHGTLELSADGVAKILGTLGDGKKWTASCHVTTDGEMPLYKPLYNKGKGWLAGLVSFRDIAEVSDCDGVMHWRKPGKSTGFNLQRNLVGSSYDAAQAAADLGANPVSMQAYLGAGAALDPFSQAIDVQLTPENGLIEGVINQSGTDYEVDGVLLQKQGLAAGIARAAGESARSMILVKEE